MDWSAAAVLALACALLAATGAHLYTRKGRGSEPAQPAQPGDASAPAAAPKGRPVPVEDAEPEAIAAIRQLLRRLEQVEAGQQEFEAAYAAKWSRMMADFRALAEAMDTESEAVERTRKRVAARRESRAPAGESESEGGIDFQGAQQQLRSVKRFGMK